MSKTGQKASHPGEEQPDDADAEHKFDGVEATSVEGGSDHVAEDAGDGAGKETKEQEEDGSVGEAREMTDEELASR